MVQRKPKPALACDADATGWKAVYVEQVEEGAEAGDWRATPDLPDAVPFVAATKGRAVGYAQALHLRVLAEKLEQAGRPIRAVRFAQGDVEAAAVHIRQALAGGPLPLREIAKGSPHSKAILRAARPRANAAARAVPGDPRAREWFLLD